MVAWAGGGGGVIYAYKYSPVFHIFPISFNCKKKIEKKKYLRYLSY